MNLSKFLVVTGDRVVVLETLLGAVLLVDVQQRDRRRVVLYQPHLGRDRDHPWDREVEEPSGGLFVLAQKVVHHSKELKHSLLPSGVGQAGVADHEVGIDLSVVASNVESPGGRVVLLNDLDLRHEPLDADVVVRVFGQQELARQLHLGCLAAEVAQEPTLFFDLEKEAMN